MKAAIEVSDAEISLQLKGKLPAAEGKLKYRPQVVSKKKSSVLMARWLGKIRNHVGMPSLEATSATKNEELSQS